ncbi:hypothetical protein [Tissierella sp.]|uniref:hypothetical protein n=1 Tax=Tissierella sp. TaxID=41274 RepID=UPI00285C163C|nr:hypothetical protein [Tissierella sp.]MDR7857272.1 hypothetical protein [Tissierella sp.]
MRKTLTIIFLILIIFLPANSLAEEIKTILVIVDELPFNIVEKLSLEKYGIGLVNLKTRSSYSEEGLYLSINTGRKLSLAEVGKKNSGIEYIGDILEKEKVSYIGEGKEDLVVVNNAKKVNYREDTLIYDLEWLVKNTDNMLSKSNLLSLGYNFEDESNRIDILSSYLKKYKDNRIIILPKKAAVEDKNLINNYIVPIIYINKQDSGVLTSLSTNREGFITLEDISVQIKNTYGYSKKTNIGNEFLMVSENEPLKEIKDIYTNTMNLLIIAFIFHGLTYLTQGLLGIWILRRRESREWLNIVYAFTSTIICISLILGFFQFHENLFLYLIIIIPIAYIIAKSVVKKNYDFVKHISILTYLLIVIGTIFYPKMIYNSYMGFNNLVYGARYYGLNNGIMGVLLATSILTYFNITKTILNANIKRLVGLLIFVLNIVVLSTRYGANTGGFITSIALFGIMMYILFLNKKISLKNIVILLFIGALIFCLNMYLDNINEGKSHAIQFFYRIKENGIGEFVSMATFKARELIKLTLSPPFSIVLIFQFIILKKLYKRLKYSKDIKEEAIIMIITSLIGFAINDTGVITFIYMMHYLIFDFINRIGIE